MKLSRCGGLVRLSVEDEAAAWELFRRRSDEHYGCTDRASFVAMKRLDLRRAAALDDDFGREEFTVAP